jgi:flagellar motor protein MotB
MQPKRQLAELQVKITDRGLVVTLGDALFATGSADLRAEAAASDLRNLIRVEVIIANPPAARR